LIISFITAVLHFIIGPASGDFVRNHLMNILLPLNLYLLLQLGFRRLWSVPVTRTLGALGVLIFAFVVEILQSYGFELFGSTYDPLDIMMAGIGVGVGFVVDITILDKIENRK
jgi:hypothetical protein